MLTRGQPLLAAAKWIVALAFGVHFVAGDSVDRAGSSEPTASTDPGAASTAHQADVAPEWEDPFEEPELVLEDTRPTWAPRDGDLLPPHRELEFPEHLDPFYARLARLDDTGDELVRVVHMGASMIGSDDLPSVLREHFQSRFGDGGAGMVLMQRYMPNYRHRWVQHRASAWHHCYIAYRCLDDGHYGLGGTAFWSSGGAETRLRTRRDHPLGSTVSHLEVWYMARPGGGRLNLKVDHGETHVIDTRADVVEDRFYALDIEPGKHTVRVRAGGFGPVRAYGVVMENQTGIVWDQFSKLGVFVRRVMDWDAEHIAGQIAHRNPDLIVFTYGGNDSRRVAHGKLSREAYRDEFAEAIAYVRAGKPEAACLVTSMTDRGKSLRTAIRSEHVETIVAAQRDAAEVSGCAFFDTYQAMGGAGSLLEWKNQRPPLAEKDLKHLNHRGRVIVGEWIYRAIMQGYVRHRLTGSARQTPETAGDE